AIRSVEEERLAETDNVCGALARRELRGIEAAESIARVRQVVRRRALAEALEVSAGRDEVREIGVRRKLTRLLRCADGFLELPLVVQLSRARQRIVLGQRGRRRKDQPQKHEHT